MQQRKTNTQQSAEGSPNILVGHEDVVAVGELIVVVVTAVAVAVAVLVVTTVSVIPRRSIKALQYGQDWRYIHCGGIGSSV